MHKIDSKNYYTSVITFWISTSIAAEYVTISLTNKII